MSRPLTTATVTSPTGRYTVDAVCARIAEIAAEIRALAAGAEPPIPAQRAATTVDEAWTTSRSAD